jgi:hypothetical protein
MAISGENINTKLTILLQDSANVRWTKEEVCGWINSAQREILIYKPNANPITGNIATVIGTKQTLPVGGIQLLDISRNMGPTATPVAGKAITNIPRTVIDRIPNWHVASSYVTPVIGVDHYAFDERFPTTFYVWPGLSAAGFVEGSYSALPTDLTFAAGAIVGTVFNDIYETPVIDYCAARCYAKDADYVGNAAKAQAYYASFMAAVAGKLKGEMSSGPTSSLSIGSEKQ